MFLYFSGELSDIQCVWHYICADYLIQFILYKMRAKIRILFFISLISLTATPLFAWQNNKKYIIKGTVTDHSENPVANAVLMIDGNKTNSVTDARGEYKVRIKPGCRRISVVSFSNGIIEDTLDGRKVIDFRFSNYSLNEIPEISESSDDEAVNTGYNYIKKKDLTTQITSIDGNNRKYASYHSITEMILREVPGATIRGNILTIQASRNMFGFIGPMIIVDGQPASYDSISPASVESISVLKGSAAAIYGTRGYGGVILIKTKSGQYTK